MLKRPLAVIGLATRTCANCKHFDLKRGQEELPTVNPAFTAVMGLRTPAQMAVTALTDDERKLQSEYLAECEAAIADGKPTPPVIAALAQKREEPPPSSPGNIWSEYGACAKRPDEAVWQGWHCEMWS